MTARFFIGSAPVLAVLAVLAAATSLQPKETAVDCTGFLVFCDPFFTFIAGSPIAILSTDPGSLDDDTIKPGNTLAAVALFSFTSERSTWALPTTVGFLTNTEVWVSIGGLRGTIPTQFGRLESLRFVHAVSSQYLTGTLPSQLGTLGSLTALTIANFPNIGGTLPSQVGLFTHAHSISIENCNLQGTLPSEIVMWPVIYLTIVGTNLTGPIPSGLSNDWVAFQDNQFTGDLPAVPQDARSYQVENNRFDGTIPTTFGPQLQHLTSVGLHNNLLTGTLPSQIVALASLSELHVQSNRLSGSLPTQLGRMTRLASLRVDENWFSGTLPSELGLLTDLTELNVGRNRLRGPVPSQLALLTGLVALNISHNAFSGALPAQLALLAALNTTSVESNRLEGDAPAEVWLQECDNSGLDSKECGYDCPACGRGRVELLECDWRGRGQWCASMLGLWIGVGAAVAFVAAAYRRINETFSVPQLAWHTGLVLFSVFETFLDLLFALRSGGVIGLIALSSFGVGRVVGVGLGAGTLVYWKRPWWHVVVGAVLCSVNASALKNLLPLQAQARSMVVGRWVVVLAVTESLVEGSLQAYSFALGDRDFVTMLSLFFSTVSLVATVTVLVVLGLANYHATKAQALLDGEVGCENDHANLLANHKEPQSDGSGEDDPDNPRRRETFCRRVARVLLCTACCSTGLSVLTEDSPGHEDWSHRVLVENSAGPLRWSDQQLVQEWVPFQSHFRGNRASSSPLALRKELSCPPGNTFSQPITCFGDQVVIILDILGELKNETDFYRVMQEPEVRLIHTAFHALPLPPTIRVMQHLFMVSLYRCSGPLPTQLGTLADLKALVVTFPLNSVTSVPTEIGNLGMLDLFYLDRSSATVPSQIGQVSTLKSLHVATLDAEPWNLPTQLGRLARLEGIVVTAASAVGTIPSQVGLLQDTLTVLDLSGNQLSGTVPSELGLLSLLELVSLAGSDLRGTMPEFLSLPALKHCEVGGQRLQGTLPSIVPVGSALEFVELGGNALHGTIPSQLGRATALTHLSLSGNSLGGTIPTQLGLLTLLTFLSLHSLDLHGPLPSQLGNLSLLETLRVDGNSLQGRVPSQLARLGVLTDVGLGHNALDGGLDSAFGTDGRAVWLEDCDMSGVDERECARVCPSCGFGAARVRACNDRGFDGVCVPFPLVLLGVTLKAGAMRFVVRRVSAQQLTPVQTAAAVAISLVSTLHILLDVLFALFAPPVIRECSFAVLLLAVFARFVLATGEFFRTQLRKHVAARQEARGRRSTGPLVAKAAGARKGLGDHGRGVSLGMVLSRPNVVLGKNDVRRAALDTKLFAAALVLCILDPSVMFYMFFSSTESESNRKDLRAKVLRAKLVTDLPLVVLQAVVVATRSDNSFALQAIVLTVLSIVLGVTEWIFRGCHNGASAVRPSHPSHPQIQLWPREGNDSTQHSPSVERSRSGDHRRVRLSPQEQTGFMQRSRSTQPSSGVQRDSNPMLRSRSSGPLQHLGSPVPRNRLGEPLAQLVPRQGSGLMPRSRSSGPQHVRLSSLEGAGPMQRSLSMHDVGAWRSRFADLRQAPPPREGNDL